jgi:hypothetical protein
MVAGFALSISGRFSGVHRGAQSDPGPIGAIKAIMDATPDYRRAVGDATTFWYAFGPVLYRGRLDRDGLSGLH